MCLGKGVRKATTGGETVQYRHEKTFYNPTLLAAQVGSDITAADLEVKLKGWNALQFERVGLNLRPELVAVKDVGGNADAFAAVAKQVAETSEFNLILMTEDADVMKAGVAAMRLQAPLDVRGHRGHCRRLRRHRQGKRPAPGHQGRFHRRPDSPCRRNSPAWASRTWCLIPAQGNPNNPIKT